MTDNNAGNSETNVQNFNPFAELHNETPANNVQETASAETNEQNTQETEVTLGEKNYVLNEQGIEAIKADFNGKVPLTIGNDTYEFDLDNPEDLEAFKKYANGESIELETEETEQNANVLKIKVEDLEEEFDITNDEQKGKLIEYAQKGRYLEREMQNVKEEKRKITEEANIAEIMRQSLEFSYLKNQGANLAVKPMFVELADTNGEIKRDEKGNPVSMIFNNVDDYIKAEAEYNKNVGLLNQYRTAFSQSATKYREQLNAFVKKFNIADADKFLLENVNPYIAPFVTAGAQPMPDDFLEMVYFWKNKGEFETKIREEERKKKATAPVSKKVTIKKANPGTNGSDFLGNLPNHKKYELINN